ncbi:MAG: EndoU domain-containing protein [Umezawaea sp.]
MSTFDEIAKACQEVIGMTADLGARLRALDDLADLAPVLERTVATAVRDHVGLTPSGAPVYPVPVAPEPFTLPRWSMPDPLHTHIFEGHRRRLRLLGYHHHSSGRIDLLGRTTPDRHQVYEARLEHVLPDGRTAAKVNSSFFPDHWSRHEVAHAIRCAFQHRTPVVRDDGRPTLSQWEGHYRGVLIRGFVTAGVDSRTAEFDDVSTAWPVYAPQEVP